MWGLVHLCHTNLENRQSKRSSLGSRAQTNCEGFIFGRVFEINLLERKCRITWFVCGRSDKFIYNKNAIRTVNISRLLYTSTISCCSRCQFKSRNLRRVCSQFHTFWLSCISYLETYTISLIYRCPAYRAFPFPHGRCILTHLNSISKIWTKKIKTNEHLMNITQNKALF